MKAVLVPKSLAVVAALGMMASPWSKGAAAEHPFRGGAVAAAFAAETPPLPGGEFWIGISAAAVDDLLKAQLRIDGGVVVQSVVPDSPAGRAGLREHDILLAFGDTPVDGVRELAEAVDERGAEETAVSLIRSGKRQTVELTPARRPESLPTPAPPAAYDWTKVREWVQQMEQGQMGPGPRATAFWRPGVVVPEGWVFSFAYGKLDVPKNTSVTITRDSEGPTRVVVRQGDREWKVDADQLDQLPAEIRKIVDSIVARRRPGLQFDADVEWFPQPGAAQDADPDSQDTPESAGDRPGGPGNTALPKLRRELESLREKMREQQRQMERELDNLRKQLPDGQP